MKSRVKQKAIERRSGKFLLKSYSLKNMEGFFVSQIKEINQEKFRTMLECDLGNVWWTLWWIPSAASPHYSFRDYESSLVVPDYHLFLYRIR